MAVFETMEEGYSSKLWAEAMKMACDMSSINTTTANEGCVSRGHKLAPWGEKYVMVGMVHNHPSGTKTLKNPKTGDIMCRRSVLWHPSRRGREKIGN